MRSRRRRRPAAQPNAHRMGDESDHHADRAGEPGSCARPSEDADLRSAATAAAAPRDVEGACDEDVSARLLTVLPRDQAKGGSGGPVKHGAKSPSDRCAPLLVSVS